MGSWSFGVKTKITANVLRSKCCTCRIVNEYKYTFQHYLFKENKNCSYFFFFFKFWFKKIKIFGTPMGSMFSVIKLQCTWNLQREIEYWVIFWLLRKQNVIWKEHTQCSPKCLWSRQRSTTSNKITFQLDNTISKTKFSNITSLQHYKESNISRCL